MTMSGMTFSHLEMFNTGHTYFKQPLLSNMHARQIISELVSGYVRVDLLWHLKVKSTLWGSTVDIHYRQSDKRLQIVLSDLTFADNDMSSLGFKLTHSVEISYFVIDVLAQTARPGDSLVTLPPILSSSIWRGWLFHGRQKTNIDGLNAMA